MTVPDVDVCTRTVARAITTRRDKQLLAEFRMHKWRGNTVYSLEHEELPSHALGLIAVGYGKRTEYLNLYTLFTHPGYRKTGVMSVLLDHAVNVARAKGLRRIKSKASSLASVRLYQKRGYLFWGFEKPGELLVDAPLPRVGTNQSWQPPTPHLWTAEDLARLLECEVCGLLMERTLPCPKCGTPVDPQLGLGVGISA